MDSGPLGSIFLACEPGRLSPLLAPVMGTNKFPREHNKTGVEVARRLTVELFPGETAGKKREALHSRSLTGVVLNKLFSLSTQSKPASEFFFSSTYCRL